jgi:hypothetical protein
MRMASALASVIANAKGQNEIQLRDLVAGTYVASFERMLRFWPDAASFEDFIAEHCDWSEHRLMTWSRWTYELEHPPRSIWLPFTGWFYQIPRKNSMIGKMFKRTDELNRVYQTAERLSVNNINIVGQVVPLITPEMFLLATIRTEGVELGSRLLEAGLRLDDLEVVACQPLQSPGSLQF